MRDYLVLGILFAALPLCFLRPFLGVLTWCWVSYMNPHRLTWGAQHFPAAQYVAIATLLGLVFTSDREKPPLVRETVLLCLLWIGYTATTFVALVPVDAWPQWEKVSKILLTTFVTLIVCQSEARLMYLMLVITLSLGFYGIKGGIFGFQTGGAYRIYGPAGSFIGDNNGLALALLMTIPLLIFLSGEQKNGKFKLGLAVSAALSLVSVILSYSRGAFVGMIAVAFMFFLKLRRRLLWAALAVPAVLIVIPFIPEQWFDRISSIRDYREDRSVQSRFNAWGFAFNLARARPLTGGGFETFHPELFTYFAPRPEDFVDAHSIYFEVLGEHGFVVFGFFVALLLSCFLSLRKLRKTFGAIPSLEWVGRCADMLTVSLVAYCVSGAFLGLAYFDLFYHVVAMVILLKEVARREYRALVASELQEEPEPVTV